MKQTGIRRRHFRATYARPPRLDVLAPARSAADPVAGEKDRQLRGIILVGVDFGESLSKAMDWVLGLAKYLSTSIVLLHVVEPLYGRWLVDSSERRSIEADANGEALHKLEAMVPPQTNGQPAITCIVRNGLPEYELLRAAEDMGADLILLGRRPKSPLHFLVFGSTTHDIIDCAPCPVLIVNDIACPTGAPHSVPLGARETASGTNCAGEIPQTDSILYRLLMIAFKPAKFLRGTSLAKDVENV